MLKVKLKKIWDSSRNKLSDFLFPVGKTVAGRISFEKLNDKSLFKAGKY